MSKGLHKSEKLLKDDGFEEFLHELCLLEDINIRLIKDTMGKRKSLVKKSQNTRTLSAVSVISRLPSIARKDSTITSPQMSTNRTKSTYYDDAVDHSDMYCYFNLKGQLLKMELKNIRVPPKLMDILKQCLRYFNALTTITIKACRAKSRILLQINYILLNTNVTELTLDNTILDYKNYHILLEKKSQLTLLSLSRCSINDSVCKGIVDRLVIEHPMASKLCVLDLSSNFITDQGATAIGYMLRTNRQLVHINLAGNQITNEGATKILISLKEFPLTHEEIVKKNRNNFTNMKFKLENENLKLTNPPPFKSAMKLSGVGGGSGKGPSTLLKRPTTILLSPLVMEEHPFHDDEINKKNDYFYCIGNTKLSSLNLAYNNLEYPIIAQITSVIEYQCNELPKEYSNSGLTRIVIDGNRIPHECPELEIINKKLKIKISNI